MIEEVMNQIEPISLFLCGDVMTGRGIDQALPHPGNPVLYESYVRDARDYLQFAEEANGPIPRPVSSDYIWGAALGELERDGTEIRIINLETAITESEDYWPDKPVLYRMNPRNIGCLTAASVSCCVLANNHMLDWGDRGLQETLQTLDAAGISHAGAGRDATEAASPAALEVAGKGRALVFSFGSPTSGVPWEWGATENSPGVNLLKDLSDDTARRIAGQMRQHMRPGAVIVASIHWGGNWGYGISDEQISFAHRLIDEGVSIVHGHSSHHVKAIEVYRERLILYGCGDFLTDYEGISGYEQFRGDLTLMYLLKVDPRQGRLLDVRMIPMQVRRFRLNRASAEDSQWLCDLLNRLGKPFGAQAQMESNHSLTLRWQ
jgi:poly-gamma-glutamate capsule biosynthesis protein CapA/YwtB (metallophosphatase superfamily)